MRVLLAAINSQFVHSSPALYALRRGAEAAGCLKEGGPELLLAEYSITMSDLRILEDIYRQRPDVLAFSCYIWNMEPLRRLLWDLRQLLPECCLLLGGPEASGRAREYLRELPVDGIFLGEGEESFPAFLQALSAGEARPGIPGLLWKGQEEEFLPAPRPDFAAQPFLYTPEELAQLRERKKIVYYESSRGCPFSCSFCGSAAEPLRERPLSLVLQELEQLAGTQTQVKFIDRTFNARSERACAITKKLLELYRPGLSWHCEISPFSLPEPLVELWLQAPPDYIKLEMGVQSLYPPALAAIGRRGDWEQAEPQVRRLIAAGNCHVHLDLIAGLPEDTPRGFAESFHRLHQLDADYLQFGFLKVLPGSLLAASAKERGLIHELQTPYRILATPTMDGDYLFRLGRAERMFNSLYNKAKLDFRPRLIAAAEKWPGGAMAMYMRAAELWDGISGLNQQDKLAMVARLEEELA
ncbi:MAG: radical SAM protein [Bacillota bacterium]|nr:radical SAM protein [Bacillota bacterium]